MAVSVVKNGPKYQLDTDQVLRASTALLSHIKAEDQRKEAGSTVKKLPLGDDSDEEDDGSTGDHSPIWLILTTKKHLVDKNRMKPGKIAVPHSLNPSSTLNVCLITADPQRAVKDTIADPAFPPELASKITKVIGFSKLRDRYKSFESRRQLLAEHDLFLADDRIILRLVNTLGKIFFKSSKRPIPVRLEEIQKVDGKRVKAADKKRPPTDEKAASVASPAIVAREIERAIACVPVNLSPAATAALRVGWSNWPAEKVVENVSAVVEAMVEKYVSRGWKNIKAVHVKGANTASMPIWLADELWLEDADVKEVEVKKVEEKSKKRKSITEGEDAGKKSKKSKLITAAADAAVDKDGEEEEELKARKAKLKAQKAKAVAKVEGDAPLLPKEVSSKKPRTKLAKMKKAT
ncbi:hypothetical protein MGYG_02377 [Nannizzia gypsea CBS 118893]|uniref:Ribosome biogenesis protein C8F11.04 n=1 Tax=Arthroderma gypseum (strain ATCC MYA-4604 / CBS 118893) TaxID=535722 RepID=E4UR91_ARTGP|nr:hypothetical protein MGYG_02377 [Nannizzia gypsea CBS 118893]EFQ99366.1 hypothetical protein MGYG_02377 [Nannizzia gypsea CBS 118893]